MRKYIPVHVLLYVQVLNDTLNKQWIDISSLMKSHGQHLELVHPYWIPVSYLFLQTLIITKYIDVIEHERLSRTTQIKATEQLVVTSIGDKSNTMGVTCGAGTTYYLGAPKFISGF
jgi:hypothetical protein